MGKGDAELGVSDQDGTDRRPLNLCFSRFRGKPCQFPRKVDLYGMGPLFQPLGEKLGHAAEGRQDDVDIVRRSDFPVRAGGANRYGSPLDVGRVGFGLPKLSGKSQSGLEILQSQVTPVGRVVGDDEHDAEELVEESDTVVKDQESRNGVFSTQKIIARLWRLFLAHSESKTLQTAVS